MDDLVKRLRGYGGNRLWPHGPACDCTQAADRIEALEVEVAQWRKAAEFWESCAALTEKKSEALEAQVRAADALAEKLEGWIGVAANCTIESGVCCCGDDMERHSSPLDCGHSPVDHGAYAATQLIDATTSALAAYRATKEGGE